MSSIAAANPAVAPRPAFGASPVPSAAAAASRESATDAGELQAGVAIRAEGLTKWFAGAGGDEAAKTYAVRDVTFEARFGEMLYIVGPSGSGKTTLLSMISGILRPNLGRVTIDGTDIWSLPPGKLAEFRLTKIGFVFQDYHLFPRLTSAENVAIPLILRRRRWDEAAAEARRDLEVVGLGARADVSPVKLSGGEQQRVAIARAIASRPEILILDEPTASLDGDTGKGIVGFVRRNILDRRRCILIVTHDSRIFEFADRILKMEDGRLCEAGDREVSRAE